MSAAKKAAALPVPASPILLISCSLDPDSRSRVLAQTLAKAFEKAGATVEFLDLREHPLPMCDGADAYDSPALPPVREAIERAAAIIVAGPVYNYYLNAAAKNLVELTGRAWNHKVVGFLCAAGGMSSYMSVMSLANSLMLDFRCIVLPRFVYATGGDFDGDKVVSAKIKDRLNELAVATLKVATALEEAGYGELR